MKVFSKLSIGVIYCIAVISLLSVKSFSACYTNTTGGGLFTSPCEFSSYVFRSCASVQGLINTGCQICPSISGSSIASGSLFCVVERARSITCQSSGANVALEWTSCDTQEEYCNQNPTSEYCFVAKDTTTYGCRDEIELDPTTGQSVTYHVVYQFTGKTTQGGGANWTSYEEKENAPMSCADVGYCSYGQTQCLGDMGGWYGGESSSSSEINWSSSSVSCKQTGQYGNTCYFECDNGAVGQCQGNDGDCSIVSDCEWQMQSSASDEPASSASGQSGSSENPDLQTIIENQNIQIEQLNYNNGKLDDLDERMQEQNNKADATNSLLSQIANNISQINNKTSIITNNTYNDGTSSESKDYTGNFDALADSLGSISGKLSEMLSGDTGTLDTSAFEIGVDSLIDTSYTTYGDSLDGAYTSFGDTYKGIISDTGAIGKFTDSLSQLQKKFNFTPLSGSGTGCPAFMQKTYSVTIGTSQVSFDLNNLKICSPILGSKTPWDIARAVLRAIVAITCMWFLFKCATGTISGDDE